MAKISLFGNTVQRACAHCKHGRKTANGDNVFCSKKGVMDAFSSCRLYKYDPLKRVPQKAKLQSDLTEKDFSL